MIPLKYNKVVPSVDSWYEEGGGGIEIVQDFCFF